MGYTGNPWRGGNASPFGTQIMSKGHSSKGGILPAIIGGLGSAFLGPAGPILGTLASGAINFGLNRIESGIQNRYNSPKNVVKRLGEAGLPTAAYLKGGGNESANSAQQYTQPDLGTAEAISREQVNRMQKQQFELMKREMALKEKDLEYREAQRLKTIQDTAQGFQNTRYLTTKADYYNPSNFARQIETGNLLRENQAEVLAIKAYGDKMQNEVYEEFKREGGQLNILRGQKNLIDSNLNTQASQRAVNAQSIQESIARMAKMMVDIEATRKQMSVADQTIRIRILEEELKQNIAEDLRTGTGGQAWLGAMLMRIMGL